MLHYYKYNRKLLPYIHINNKLLYEFIIYAIVMIGKVLKLLMESAESAHEKC